MKCPNCGNEIHPGEAFCGQCGTPVVPPAPATNQTEMMSTPSNAGPFNSYQVQQSSQAQFGSASGQPSKQGILPTPPISYGVVPPTSPVIPVQAAQQPQQSQRERPFPTNTRPISPQIGSSGSQQQEDFYQDATEAISSLPSIPSQGYASNFQRQQTFPITPPNNYPTMGTHYGGQSGQYGFPEQAGPQNAPFQPQRRPPLVPPSSQRQPGNTGIVIVCILLALVLLAIIGLGTLYFVHSHNVNQQASQNAAAHSATATTSANDANVTGTASANATSTAISVSTPTVVPTATTAPSPTPTIVPTATPDANFTYCGQPCIANGYETEYPNGWNQSSDTLSIQFVNPAQPDEFITFRTPQTAANSASDVVSNDLQTYYASKPDYTVSPQSLPITISGETWIETYATYQGSTQNEKVEIFGTIHAGKSYVIELQAATDQFEQVNSQYFVNVTGRFQFQQ